eukprot:1387850-Pleurochrysis_carterae.AAC.3
MHACASHMFSALCACVRVLVRVCMCLRACRHACRVGCFHACVPTGGRRPDDLQREGRKTASYIRACASAYARAGEASLVRGCMRVRVRECACVCVLL